MLINASTNDSIIFGNMYGYILQRINFNTKKYSSFVLLGKYGINNLIILINICFNNDIDDSDLLLLSFSYSIG